MLPQPHHFGVRWTGLRGCPATGGAFGSGGGASVTPVRLAAAGTAAAAAAAGVGAAAVPAVLRGRRTRSGTGPVQVSGPCRAAHVLRGLDGLADDEVRRVLGAAGVVDPGPRCWRPIR
ncbi:hypothetical protein NKH18_12545 [Streptomyces sp. M10(2022)]